MYAALSWHTNRVQLSSQIQRFLYINRLKESGKCSYRNYHLTPVNIKVLCVSPTSFIVLYRSHFYKNKALLFPY